MAAVSVTAAEVTVGQKNQTTPSYQCGEAVTAGQAVYYLASEDKVYLANNDDETTASVKGVTLGNASADGFVPVAEKGLIDPGFAIAEGHLYYLGATDGAIVPVGDVTGDSGAIVSAIYRGVAGGLAKLEINNTGSTIA